MKHRYSVMPFLLAFFAAVAAMPTNVYQVCAWNVGTLKLEPWRVKASAAVTAAKDALLNWFARLCSPQAASVCAAVLLAVLVANLSAGHDGVLAATGGVFAIARPKLVAELEEAKVKAKGVMETAEKENRELTKDERTKVQEHLDEAKRIDARIKSLDGDEEMRKQIEALGGGKEREAFAPGQSSEKEKHLTVGQQFVRSDAYKAIQAGKHRQGTFTASLEIASATLTEDAASGGDLVQPMVVPGILPVAQRRIMVPQLIAPGTTESNTIEYLEETTFTNAAAARAEGAAAAESTLIFDRKSTTVRSIAHFLPVTNEMLEDVAQAQSYIDGRLRLGLGLAEEDQLLNGTGVAPQLQGIYTHGSLHAAQARGVDSNADAIFKQIMALASDSYIFPDGIVLNPSNWQTIVLAKDGSGQYFGMGPFSVIQVPVLWGLPVSVTPVIAATNALVGPFAAGAQRFVKRGATVTASNSHSDYFTKKLVAILAEQREALAVYRPAAFGKVTGLN